MIRFQTVIASFNVTTGASFNLQNNNRDQCQCRDHQKISKTPLSPDKSARIKDDHDQRFYGMPCQCGSVIPLCITDLCSIHLLLYSLSPDALSVCYHCRLLFEFPPFTISLMVSLFKIFFPANDVITPVLPGVLQGFYAHSG